MRSTLVIGMVLFVWWYCRAPAKRSQSRYETQRSVIGSGIAADRSLHEAKMRERPKIDMMNGLPAENQKKYMALLPYLVGGNRSA